MTDDIEDTETSTISADDMSEFFVPCRADTVGSVMVGDEAIVLDELTGEVHLLMGTAAVVWECFDGQGTIREISEDLADVYGADVDVVAADVVAAAQRLGRSGLLIGVTRERAGRSRQDSGLPVGSPLPDFELRDPAGRRITNGDLAGRPALVVNWSYACHWCGVAADDLAAGLDGMHRKGVELVLVSSGSVEDNVAMLSSHSLLPDRLLLRDLGAENPVFGPMGTPAAYLVDAAGAIAEPLAVGADSVPQLALRIAEDD